MSSSAITPLRERTQVGASTAAAQSLDSPERTRSGLSAKQSRTVESLIGAAVEELRFGGYEHLTVRNVARRAGVAPATAYTYFTSREHLVTEVFWRRLWALPETPVDRRRSAVNRVSATMSDLSLLVADEPELASACTAAMLATDAEVALLRDRIGAEMRRRLASALGDQADPDVLGTLEFVISGALMHAGVGHMTYSELPLHLARAVQLVVPGVTK
ncbi:MAG: TetR/AcrR family transcriptional regulator [Actinobacteria bacterium]|nr:TetR/AcrR family transcriptional regulator [Actinomycetota bacterium]